MFLLIDGREKTNEGEELTGLIPVSEPDWSVDRCFRDGMGMGLVGLGMELDMEGTDDTRFSDRVLMASLSSCAVESHSSAVKRTSTLITLRKPRPMGGMMSCTEARNSSDPISVGKS